MSAAGAHVPRPRPAEPGAVPRLRWWALLLPVAVFLALLALLVTGDDGRSAQSVDDLWAAASAAWAELRSLGSA